MSNGFLTEDFLLQNKTAKSLYHDIAAHLPIIDYHSHLPPDDIANNRKFETITNIWLDGDHYKWRAMRALGIDEKYISGKASDEEKFQKWAATVPYTMRNPLYHWTHLELKNYFGIHDLLSDKNASDVYHTCNKLLAQNDYSTVNLLKRMNVELVCTTDDPADDLKDHRKIADQNIPTKVLPTFRPDNVYTFTDVQNWNRYINKLERASDISISDLPSLLDALEQRIKHFDDAGCMLSDHGLTEIVFVQASQDERNSSFNKIRNGNAISKDEQHALTTFILIELGKMYHARGWAQQFHIGAFRMVNTRMTKIAGPNTGFDSIADYQHGPGLGSLLDALDVTDQLPKTILYNLNPADNAMFATMAGNFNDGSVKGKVQYGPAWWFLDQKDGMEEHLKVLSNMGLISCFLGMLTDSRSFLSYSRHEYFRRILCNLIGGDVERGELPNDMQWLGKIVTDICYQNAKDYFQLS